MRPSPRRRAPPSTHGKGHEGDLVAPLHRGRGLGELLVDGDLHAFPGLLEHLGPGVAPAGQVDHEARHVLDGQGQEHDLALPAEHLGQVGEVQDGDLLAAHGRGLKSRKWRHFTRAA